MTQINISLLFMKGRNKCEVCNKSFILKNDIAKHFASVHGGKKPFKCEVWDKSFIANNDLNKHFASVHKGKKWIWGLWQKF